MHFLGSDQPIPSRSAQDLLARMPANSVADLAEWEMRPGDGITEAAYRRLNALLTRESSLDQMIATSPNTPSLTDDRPVNEYYIVRKWVQRWNRFMARHH
jgi:hypothetical protein